MDPDAGLRRGLAHRGQHRIVGFAAQMRPGPLPVAVEQPAHLRREQHRRAARRRLVHPPDQLRAHWRPGSIPVRAW